MGEDRSFFRGGLGRCRRHGAGVAGLETSPRAPPVTPRPCRPTPGCCRPPSKVTSSTPGGGDLLWFTLITGTNRLKTLDEITRKNVDQRDDFVHINSSGWDNLQAVLALVPRGTPVVLDGKIPGLPPLGEQSRNRILQMLRALGP